MTAADRIPWPRRRRSSLSDPQLELGGMDMPARGRKPRPPHLRILEDDGETRELAFPEIESHRCGAIKDTDGRSCRNPVRVKGTFCHLHVEDGKRRVADCPIPLPEEAAAIWQYLTPELKALGLFKRTYFPTIAGLCVAIASQIAAADELFSGTLLVKGYRGEVKKNPIFQIWRDCNTQVRLYSAELGLTPSAASRFGDLSTSPDERSEMEKLIAGD